MIPCYNHCMKRRSAVPVFQELIERETGSLVEIMQKALPEALSMERYLSWQELRYRKAPDGLSKEQWWLGVKLHRTQARQSIPLRNARGALLEYIGSYDYSIVSTSSTIC